MTARYDVCIMGAGMAGLTLARQLLLRDPSLAIALVEHRRFPVPEATHKVGESTVEIAAHYLAETLGLKQHLEDAQLPKFGLRLFFRGAEPIERDLAEYDELGASRVLPIPTYQIDRGRLENHLAGVCRDMGASLLDGVTLRGVCVNPGAHRVTVRDGSAERELECRFLVDASGRRGLLRRQCDLAREVRHNNHAVWFRVEGELDLDRWSCNEGFLSRCADTPRLLSTNHFTGPGYWLWLIPLASNATSVGVVLDPKYLELARVSRHDRFMAWAREEHPLVAAALDDRPALDYHVLKNYAVGATQVFSDAGWATTGDAGAFSDPFYSPGGDFIALANGYVTELVTGARGRSCYREFQNHFLSFFVSTLSLYKGQYGGFGNRNLMVVKTIWDFSYYWAVLSKLFFAERFTDPRFMAEVQPVLLRAAGLNSGLQRAFRQAAEQGGRVGGAGDFYDYHSVPYFHRVKEELLQGDTGNVAAELEAGVAHLATVADSLKRLLQEGGDRPLPSLERLGRTPAFA